jgi:hypothetical protein
MACVCGSCREVQVGCTPKFCPECRTSYCDKIESCPECGYNGEEEVND